MARRQSDIVRVPKTLRLLPETKEFIEAAAKSTGEYESTIVDKAIALLRSREDADLSIAS